ncbi:MAG: ATP-grasp domain-containing protein [Gammaproteobacteria bacterium]|nr:ATP-grasp domain-containing protein [Gammaproteobacteria bacterium]
MLNYALIIDPFSSGALYADELKKKNIIPLAVLSQIPVVDCFAASYRPDDFEKIFIFEGDLIKLTNEIRTFLANNRIVLCLPGTDLGTALSDQLTNLFCPSTMNDPDRTLARTNKYFMATELKKANILIPLTYQVNSLEAAITWVNENNLNNHKIVVKPVNSAGSDGVSICFNQQDMTHAIKQLLGEKNKFNRLNKHVLIQEFLEGSEYIVDSVSYNGKHQITNIGKYKKIVMHNGHFIYDSLDFLPFQGEEQKQLIEYCYQVLNALGIKYGPAHAEIMLAPNGPRLIEVGSRLHGGVAILAVRLATGTSQLDLTLDYLISNIPFTGQTPFVLKNQVKIVFLISNKSGKITKLSDKVEAIKQLPSFGFMKSSLKKNTLVTTTVDLFTSPGLIILSHPDPQQIDTDYQAIRAFEQEGLFETVNDDIRRC